ncbi:hypothetical protein BDD12DRAFT_888288 [Trichophaea hybrida]|nr:hypothetical protein BDD12DRAFT_888288 [Trichophaea hybrida]
MTSMSSTSIVKLPPGLPDNCSDGQIQQAYDKGELWKTFMHVAAYNNLDMIKRLIGLKYDVDTKIPHDERNPYEAHYMAPNIWHSPTPLHVALIYGSEDVADALVEAEADLKGRMVSAIGKRTRSIFHWRHHTPLTWTLLGPFSNDLYQLIWDKTPKDAIPKNFSAIDDIARAGNNYRHARRLEFLFDDENGQGTEWTPEKVTDNHILIAARGYYEQGHTERNATRENILEMLIMRAGGFDAQIVKELIQRVKPVKPKKGEDQHLRRSGIPDVWDRIHRIQRRHTPKIPAIEPKPRHPVKEFRVVELDLMLDNKRWEDMEKEWRTDKGANRYLAPWQRSAGAISVTTQPPPAPPAPLAAPASTTKRSAKDKKSLAETAKTPTKNKAAKVGGKSNVKDVEEEDDSDA